MPFIMQCNNKGCYKEQPPLLNTETNDVICSECGGSISNITSFAKNQLKFFKQTTKNRKTGQAFAVKCEHCNGDASPTITGDNFFCSLCTKQLNNISDIFKKMLKDKVK